MITHDRPPRLALAVLTVAFATAAVVVGALFPHGEAEGATIASGLRTWCLGGDGGGSLLTWRTALAVGLPLLVMAAVVTVARRSLAAVARERPHLLVGHAVAATLYTLAGILILQGRTAAPPPPPEGSLTPVERRVALRTADLELVDEKGQPFHVSDSRGHPTVVLSFFATCPAACPIMFAKLKQALAQLDARERAAIRVVAITMDPERDDVAAIAALSRAHGLEAEGVRLATGSKASIDAILDELAFARVRDLDTGFYLHDVIYMVLDAEGRPVFRAPVNERGQEWLLAALRQLLAEQRG